MDEISRYLMENDEELSKKKVIRNTKVLAGPESSTGESLMASSTPMREVLNKEKTGSNKEEEAEEEIEEQGELGKEERLWRIMEKMAAKKTIGKIKPFTGNENLDEWFRKFEFLAQLNKWSRESSDSFI